MSNSSIDDLDELQGLVEAAECAAVDPRPQLPNNGSEHRLTAVEATANSQWAEISRGVYRASGKTIAEVPAGVYTFGFDQSGNLLVLETPIITDDLLVLPDTESQSVLESISSFWTKRDKFKQRGQVFKRGIILWGPPGSGKTATIMLLTKDLVQRNGIVVYASRPEVATLGLRTIRQVEPERPIICVLEDIDEIVQRYGEHDLLALLDGEMQTENVVFLATTNYPEVIAKRIINRPSRFDEVRKIGMPSAAARSSYLRSRLTPDELSNCDLEKWVNETDGFSIAHLKELMVCVYCLDRDYDETLARLRKMDRALNGNDRRQIGLLSK